VTHEGLVSICQSFNFARQRLSSPSDSAKVQSRFPVTSLAGDKAMTTRCRSEIRKWTGEEMMLTPVGFFINTRTLMGLKPGLASYLAFRLNQCSPVQLGDG
jgi:hypothetical protein